jgi:hypothetical protein
MYGWGRQATDNNIIQRMRFACWITKSYEHTHSEYVTLIAFPRQQRLRERASILSYTFKHRYITNLFLTTVFGGISKVATNVEGV